jgi:hypothetical protein
VGAATVARRSGRQTRGGVASAGQYPRGPAHGEGGDGLAAIAPEEGRRHPGYGDDRVSAAARLRWRRLRERRQEGGLPG